MNITVRQLKAFMQIVRTGSINQAAQTLSLSNGAVSQTLGEFEKQLGTQVFDRRNARLFLNAEGRRLLPIADEILQRLRDVNQDFGVHPVAEFDLKIGCTRTIGDCLLPSLLSAFMIHFGRAPKFSINNTATIVELLWQYQIDLALIEGFSSHAELIQIPWLEDEMVVIASPNHPFAQRRAIALEELQQESWLLREQGSSTRQFFDQHLGQYLPAVQLGQTLESTLAILGAVSLGQGISLISNRLLSLPFFREKFAVLDMQKVWVRRFMLTYLKNKHLDETILTWLKNYSANR